MPTYAFTDLDRVTDQIHALFDGWVVAGAFSSVLCADGVEVLRLAVHEWVANLVQHAHFPDAPRIELAVAVEDDGVRCRLVDSSAGFDLATQLKRQRLILEAPAPSERGRGLLMLITSTADLTYAPAGPGGPQRLTFVVRDPGEDFFKALFRPEDLATDPTFARSIDSFARSIGGPPSGDGQGGRGLPHPAPAAAPVAAPRADDR